MSDTQVLAKPVDLFFRQHVGGQELNKLPFFRPQFSERCRF
jgi:hypothetical protein